MTINLLIADDHAVVRAGIRLLLESQTDMRVIGEASDGTEAYEQALSLKPDVIIMDIAMGQENGLSATHRIKQDCPGIEVLILTMFDDKDLLFNALHAGASGYIVKNVRDSDLIDAVRAVHSGSVYLHPPVEKKLIQDYYRQVSQGRQHFSFTSLSAREQEVISLAAKGFSNKDIAAELHMSVKTVEAHKTNIMRKLQLSTRQELVSYAFKHGLLHFG